MQSITFHLAKCQSYVGEKETTKNAIKAAIANSSLEHIKIEG
jgi:hypothetical protein